MVFLPGLETVEAMAVGLIDIASKIQTIFQVFFSFLFFTLKKIFCLNGCFSLSISADGGAAHAVKKQEYELWWRNTILLLL